MTNNIMPRTRQNLSCPICTSTSQFAFQSNFYDVYQCDNKQCNHLFAGNAEPSSGEGTYSDKLYTNYLKAERDDNLVRFLHSINFFNSYSKILDFGAGPGFLSDAIKRILGEETNISCIEASKSFTEHLIGKGYTVYPNFDGLPQDFKFDSAMVKEVIEHLQDPVSLMTSLRKHQSENAQILITTPAGDWRDRSHPERAKLGVYQDKTHIQYFTEKSLKLCLKKAGFSYFNYCYLDVFYPNLDRNVLEVDKRAKTAYKNYHNGTYQHLTYFIM
ncbi:MAG: class I SAM-dependent methyltransferase [Cyanobacteriota bacterium]|nr:class I SAM-dependent methyltransferase [Cyanobacteriota bacterium]